MERLVSPPVNCYTFHYTGNYGCRKASPSRRRAFLVPREIYALLYRRTPGVGEEKSGIGCRQSNVGVGPRLKKTQRNETCDRVDYPDNESIYSMGGKSGWMMYIASRRTRSAEKGGRGGIGRGLGVRTLSGRYTSMCYAIQYMVVYHIHLLANIRGPFIRACERTSISLDDWGFF